MIRKPNHRKTKLIIIFISCIFLFAAYSIFKKTSCPNDSKAQQNGTAIKCLEDALAKDPGNTDLLCKLGNSYIWYLRFNINISTREDKTERNEILEKAKKCYQESLKLDSKNLCGIKGLGEYYSFKRDYQNELKQYKQLISITPEDQEIQKKIGEIYIKIGNKELAKNAFNKYLNGKPINEEYVKKYKSRLSESYEIKSQKYNTFIDVEWTVVDATIYKGTLRDESEAEDEIETVIYMWTGYAISKAETIQDVTSEKSRLIILNHSNKILEERYGIRVTNISVRIL